MGTNCILVHLPSARQLNVGFELFPFPKVVCCGWESEFAQITPKNAITMYTLVVYYPSTELQPSS